MATVHRVTAITGGAYGIGRAIVQLFSERGDRVVFADLNPDRGQVLEAELRARGREAVFVPADVREEESVSAFISKATANWGRLDVLCNNAGIERYKRAEEYTLEDWNDIVNTNLRGAFLCSKHALPHLRESRGSIVNLSSVQGLACERNISVYAASKAGILALTRGLALDYAKEGVRVNAICPGAIMTGMQEAFLAIQSDPQATIAALSESIPLCRIGEPEDIARVVYFLASPDAAYITGATIVVDGGVLAKLAL